MRKFSHKLIVSFSCQFLFLVLLPLLIFSQDVSTSQPETEKLKKTQEIKKSQTSETEEKVPPDSIPESVLVDIETRLKKIGQSELIKDIWMGIDLPILGIQPTDSDMIYNYSGSSYSLIRVDDVNKNEILMRLEKLAKLPVTECYEISGPLLKIPTENRCRFVRGIPFEKETFDRKLQVIHRRWQSVLGEALIRTIWVESAARVTIKGSPLKKIDYARPIALDTDKGLFLFVEQVFFDKFAKQAYVQGSRAFSLTNVANLRNSNIRLRDIFFEEINKEFTAEPLLTNLALDERRNDDQIVFKRWNQKSQVVGREMFFILRWLNSAYEKSTFLIQWNCDNGCQEVKLLVEHEFFLSSDNKTFDESRWSSDQIKQYMELYRRAVTTAYSNALQNTCNRLSGVGMMSNNICKIRGNF